MSRSSRDPELRQLRQHLGALRRRLWFERLLGLGTRSLVVGFGLALVIAVVAWATLTPLAPTYYGGPVAAALAAAMLISLFRYPSPVEAARVADRRLGLRERVGTAVELARGGLDGPFARRQVATAVDAAGWAEKHWRGAARGRRELGLAVALGLLTLGMLLLTGLEDRLPAPIPRPSIASLLPAPAAPSEPPPAGAAEEPSPPAQPERAAPAAAGGRTSSVARSLDELRRARESGAIGAREAADRLAQAEAELNRQTQQSRAQREALDRLGQALDQVAAGRPASESIERGDYERAGQEIGALGTESDQLSQQAKAQLAQGLRSAAAESQSSPELAARERRAAEALPGREYEAAQRAMQELGQEVARRGNDVVPQQELAQAWDRVNQERRSQGQPETSANAQGQPGQQPAQQRSAQAPREGAGSPSSGSGAGTEPGGNGGDEGTAGEGDGSGGQATGQAANAPPDGPGLGELEPSGQAQRLDVQGRPVEVDVTPGQRSGQRPGEATGENEQGTDEVGAISAVSGNVPSRITSAAPAESNFVPTDRRQVVRDYFSSGNGSSGNGNPGSGDGATR
jgi:hypothetical protein